MTWITLIKKEPTVEDRVRSGIQVQLHLKLVTLSREGAWGWEEEGVEMF